MAKDYTAIPLTQMRRQDREVTDEVWIRSFLHRASFCALATAYEEQPFINTNLFVYDEPAHVIYLHTAKAGRTLTNIKRSELVCFSISEMGRLLPADEALEFSVEYSGVIIFGRATIIEDLAEAKHGLQLLLDKYAPHLIPGRDYHPITLQELKRTAVYRIEIEQWSGKKKEASADFPGAFYYNDQDAEKYQEYRRGNFLISTNPGKMDPALIYDFLAFEAYWSSGITKEKVLRFLRHSSCFGIFDTTPAIEKQIGFGRAVTDFTTFAYIADVFVLEPYRGQGLGKWLVECMLAHPDLQGLRKWTLHTKDAHSLYQKFRFKPDPQPENFMMFRPGDPDW